MKAKQWPSSWDGLEDLAFSQIAEDDEKEERTSLKPLDARNTPALRLYFVILPKSVSMADGEGP